MKFSVEWENENREARYSTIESSTKETNAVINRFFDHAISANLISAKNLYRVKVKSITQIP